MGKSSNLANLLSGTGKIDSQDIEVGATVSNGYVSSTFASNTSFEALKSNSLGRRNLIINGAMQVAQRGTSIACPISAITYTMDRFLARPNSSTATTVSQVTDAPDGFQYSARVTRDSGQTGTLTRFETPLETSDIIKLRGQKVTVSFYAKAGSNLSTSSDVISLILFQGNGTEGARAITAYTNETTLINSPKTLTTSWQRFTHTTTNAVASDTTQLAIQFQAAWSGTAGANDEYFITGVQLELGDTATPFEHRSYGEELALCQRYYNTDFAIQYATIGSSYDDLSTIRYAYYIRENYPVTMRTNPTLTYIVAKSYAQSETLTINFQNFGNTNKKFSIRNGASSPNGPISYQGDISLDYTADAEL